MLIRVAVLRRREDKPDKLLVKSEEFLVEDRAEAKLTILMNHATELKDIPKGELAVVCSDFIYVR